jgi:hypothetical protein
LFTDTTRANTATDAIRRRGVGKAAWRRVIENLIFSEKEDMKDLAALRRLLGNNAEAQRIIAEMQERKTIRVIELNDLLRYQEKSEGRP